MFFDFDRSSYGDAMYLHKLLVCGCSPLDVGRMAVFEEGVHSRAISAGMLGASTEATLTRGGLAGGGSSLFLFAFLLDGVGFEAMFVPLAP
jgi:hypothetical protein